MAAFVPSIDVVNGTQGVPGPQGIQGPQGPQGIPGPAGDDTVQHIAAISLGGHRLVVLNSSSQAIYADNSNLTHKDKILGLTTGAVTAGATATIQTYGEISEVSWSWTLDLPIYASTDGLLTQTPPTTGFLVIVGFPISTTSMFISIKESLTLL